MTSSVVVDSLPLPQPGLLYDQHMRVGIPEKGELATCRGPRSLPPLQALEGGMGSGSTMRS